MLLNLLHSCAIGIMFVPFQSVLFECQRLSFAYRKLYLEICSTLVLAQSPILHNNFCMKKKAALQVEMAQIKLTTCNQNWFHFVMCVSCQWLCRWNRFIILCLVTTSIIWYSFEPEQNILTMSHRMRRNQIWYPSATERLFEDRVSVWQNKYPTL